MRNKKWIPLIFGIAILIIICSIIYGCSKKITVEEEGGGRVTVIGDDHLVKGIDLSVYQGTIDWKKIVEQHIDFAFIKATEGSDYIDPQFNVNWKDAQETEIKIGAYHFLNYDVSGKDQAKNFIKYVHASDKTLPPVLDLELYGQYEDNPLEKEKAVVIIKEFLDELENHYKVKPIIYTTPDLIDLYLGTEYKEYKIWIVDINNRQPEPLSTGQDWTFWQFSHRGVLGGYDGDERFIDMNLYNGDHKKFMEEFF